MIYIQVGAFLTGPERLGQRLSTKEHFICGGAAGFISSFVEGPIDLVKFLRQNENELSTSHSLDHSQSHL